MSEFDIFARYYDLDFAAHDEDVVFYQSFARRCGSPVLEIGAGTGRLLVPLARAGYRVTGVDVSPAMLRAASSKVEAADVGKRVTLVQADARQLALGTRFKLAFIAANTMMHFTSTADQTRVLRSIHDHLVPGGLLIVDVFNPNQYVLNEPDGLVIHDYTRTDERTGNTVMKFQTRQTDQARQMMDVTFFYDEIAPDGEVRRTVAPFALHYFTYNELTLLLTRGGFQVEQAFGSYELEEYAAQSARMIFVAARTDG